MSIIIKLSGLSTIYSNDIITTGNVDCTQDISGYTILGNPSSYFTGIQSNIQIQINNLQTTLNEIGSITISGSTLSGIVFLPYLQTYYYNKNDVDSTIAQNYNTIIDTLENYYTKSSINSITKSISDNIISISGILSNTIII